MQVAKEHWFDIQLLRSARFTLSAISFYRAIFSKDGMKSNPEKGQSIQDLPTLETFKQLQFFLGLINYMQPIHTIYVCHHCSALWENEALQPEHFHWFSLSAPQSFPTLLHEIAHLYQQKQRHHHPHQSQETQSTGSLHGKMVNQ